MSEWQPAIIRLFHNREVVPLKVRDLWKRGNPPLREMAGKRVMIRETSNADLEAFAMLGCNATRFFHVQGYAENCVCEHEILTD